MNQDFVWVRSKEDLANLTHLIIPGGESTTLRLLLQEFGMWEVLKLKIKNQELKILGTCAGAVLAVDFGLSCTLDRNAYGSQLHSFVDRLSSRVFPDFTGVFIRAPRFGDVSTPAKSLVVHNDVPVLVEQENILAATFHPEMTDDVRLHEYFLGY